MRDEILLKLREIEALLADATCDGEAIEEGDAVHNRLVQALCNLEEAVDYYVD